MRFQDWLNSQWRNRYVGEQCRPRSGKRASAQPRLELLEDRMAPAIVTVNTNADANTRDNFLSLREAILVNTGALAVNTLSAAEQLQVNGAVGNDTIAFAPAAFLPAANSTIALGTALPDLSANVTIQGLGANLLTV